MESRFGGLHLADSSFSLKCRIIDDDWTGFLSAGLVYTVKVPTGGSTEGFGSGGFDHGISLLSRLKAGPVRIYLNPSVAFLSDPETLGPEIESDTVFGIFGGLEYIIRESWSLAAQLNYYTSPFEDTGIPQLDDSALELTVGTIYAFSQDTNLEFSFSEDLRGPVPDFNIHLRINYTFGF